MLLLSGCSLVPQYQRPALAVPVRFPPGWLFPDAADRARGNAEAPDASIGWQEFFSSDPVLSRPSTWLPRAPIIVSSAAIFPQPGRDWRLQ